MIYKGYRILANTQRSTFYETNDLGQIGEEVGGINYQTLDDEVWYSVIDKDNFCVASFETINECKEHIKENQ